MTSPQGRLEDRAEHGDADRDAELARGVVERGGQAAALGRQDPEPCDRGQRVDEADADPGEHEPRHERRLARVRLEPVEDE
jgi:hypothetical protein